MFDSSIPGSTNYNFGVADYNCEDCVHVDLTLNPERYTGYSGEASRRIWRSIYEENCFR
jgi:hypothetical protein